MNAKEIAPVQPAASPLLMELQKVLSDRFTDMLPAGGYITKLEKNTLTVNYKTRNYRVYNETKSGDYTDDMHEETGPRTDGFMLQLYIAPRESIYIQMLASNPAILRHPYWDTEIAYFWIADSTDMLIMSLNYGAKIGAELLGVLRTYVSAYTKPQNLPTDLQARVDTLLLEAKSKINTGLRQLAVKYPHFNTGNNCTLEETLSQKQLDNGISIYFAHHSGGKGGVTTSVGKDETFIVLIVLRKQTERSKLGPQPQLGYFDLYPNLLLGGQINVGAGNDAIDKALKQLVKDALEPLKRLDEEVGKAAKDKEPVKTVK